MDSSVSEAIDDDNSKPNSQSQSQTHNNNNNNHSNHQKPVLGSSCSSSTFIGKHRLAALISQLNQQIQIIQEELDQLETLGESSLVCEEVINSVESSTDALLPVTKAPADAGWERWFQGAHHHSSSRNRKRWL